MSSISRGSGGRIGEITAAYVVVNIWDKRQLIVPLSKIVNSPIENWTRDSADVLGTVAIYVDYRAPIDEIRAEVMRILEGSGKWDGVAASVLVTDATESHDQGANRHQRPRRRQRLGASLPGA